MSASTGRFDFAMFEAMKKATGEKKRRLLGQLVQDNDPLTKVLTAQLCGRGENRPGRRQKFKREPYVENLSVEEQDAAGRIGMAKALMKFSPAARDKVRASHGLEAAADPGAGLPAFAVWRIKFELQQAIERSGCITIRRGVAPEARPRGIERLDDPEHVERVLVESEEFSGRGADAVGESLRDRLAREEAEDAGEMPEHPRPESAVAHFLEHWCDFGREFRMLRRLVLGAYEYQASVLGFPSAPVVLERRLAQRGALLTAGTVKAQGRGKFWIGVRVRDFVEVQRRIRILA